MLQKGNQVSTGKPSVAPLYQQIEADLLKQITHGDLGPGVRVPSELELCEHYGVSRITVRRAIRELEIRGFVHRQQGKGTFVSRFKVRREMSQLTGFSDEVRAQGHVPGSQLLNLQHKPASESVALLLDLEEGDRIWIVERLRLADDEVVSWSISYLHLPPEVYLTPGELNTEVSLWRLLESKGIRITEGDTTIRAAAADAKIAHLLCINEGDPVLFREGANYSETGELVESFQIISHADRYQYSLHLNHLSRR